MSGFGEFLYPHGAQHFCYEPVLIPFKERVVSVACGQGHILALTGILRSSQTGHVKHTLIFVCLLFILFCLIICR